MKPYLFNAILGFLALIVLLLPFTGKVHDGRFRWFKGFTIRGWIVLAAFIASITVNYFKDLQADKDDIEKNRIVKIEKRQDDSIARKRNDESNAKIVTTFTDALAKHGLKYDSVEKIIQKLVKDSLRKETKVVRSDEPNLDICNIQQGPFHSDTTELLLSLCATKSTVYNIQLKVYQAYELENKFFLVNGVPDFYAHNGTLAVDKKFIGSINFIKLDHRVRYMEFLFIGTYTNEDNKIFHLRTIYNYDFIKKTWGMENEPYYSNAVTFFHKKGVIF